ncbi:MAG TPA: DUF4185 domain-containing protein [Polyangiaceae bacterium]
MRWIGLAGFCVLACSAEPPGLHAEPWPEATALFRSDSEWIGGDGAYSVDLGNQRVLWLFGDSLIAKSSARSRDDAFFIRNSVAIQTGYDPTRAFMRFYYRVGADGASSFLPEDGKYWFWPGHGIRLGDRLLLFYGRVFQQSEGMWGFASGDSTAFAVDNPDDEPSAWQPRELTTADSSKSIDLGGAVLSLGAYLYVYGAAGDLHDIYLARFSLAAASAGDLTSPEWWNGSSFGDASGRTALISPGAPEFSVNYAPALGKYLFFASEGFGASTLAIRSADAPEGPWSEPRDVLRPSESFSPDAFVYAGKAHPEQRGADLAATYVPSSMDGAPPDPNDDLYYPRFVRVSYR